MAHGFLPLGTPTLSPASLDVSAGVSVASSSAVAAIFNYSFFGWDSVSPSLGFSFALTPGILAYGVDPPSATGYFVTDFSLVPGRCSQASLQALTTVPGDGLMALISVAHAKLVVAPLSFQIPDAVLLVCLVVVGCGPSKSLWSLIPASANSS